MSRKVTFYDSYWYCYSNSTVMLLSSISETVSPRLVEALSGVGLGAFISTDGLPFFSGLTSEPDAGISRALRILGFTVEETAFEKPTSGPAFEQLRSDLASGPVLLGPLDMTHLTYNPNRPNFSGVDHFVLIFGERGGCFLLHDPAGFGNVFISEADLEKAWRADAIEYRRGHYRCWTRPRRISTPSDDEIFREAISTFKKLYVDAEVQSANTGRPRDKAAIAEMARRLSSGTLTPGQRGHLTKFALPLGVKRAFDYADFFEARHPSLSKLKRDQAAAFGRCLSYVMLDNQDGAIGELQGIATLEAEIENEIVKA
jgi:hypothetical protein